MKHHSPITLGLLTTLLSAMPVLALSENRMESFIIAEGKHPTAYQHALVVPEDSEGDVNVCFGYANDGKFGSTGSFKGIARLTRSNPDTGDAVTEKIRKQGKLSKNKWLRCVVTGPVRTGDTLVFDYEFRDFRKIRGETIHIRSSVGTDRMLVRELRGREARGNLGEKVEFHHRVRTNKTATGKHPKTWQQAYVVPITSVAETVHFCFGYGNNFKKNNRGSVTGTARIGRTDPDTGEVTTQKFKKKDDVKDNKTKRCQEIDRLHQGDTVVVDYEFTDMPKLAGKTFQVKTGIGPRPMAIGEIFPKGSRATGPEPDDPGEDPFPNPGGVISAADQLAASSLLIKSKKTQLWRFKNNQPKHWTVIGPKTQRGSGLGGVNPATAGYGDTIAEAVRDYEKKMGKLPAGGGLSASDVAALEWYSKMKTNGGPTSIRRDAGGGYHGEYFRPGKGSVVVGGLKGITGCVDWFKAQGL